ncbi:MAG: hypothetical protein ACI35O_04090 [Bacillaceae bacterium]
MNVYVIEMYDDQEVVKEIMDKAFTSYRDASQSLLNKGYDVFVEKDDEWNLYFEKVIWHEKQWYIKTRIIANIIKLELIE